MYVVGYESSRLFSKAPTDIIEILKSQNVTYNLHRYCLTEPIIDKYYKHPEWKVIATNTDHSNLEFISVLEHIHYPTYGVQFHPEKNAFEFKKNVGIPHSIEAVRATQYFSNFFVDECRKNNNTFPSIELEKSSLIYNFNSIYTGKNNSAYEQIYVFQKNDYEYHQLV